MFVLHFMRNICCMYKMKLSEIGDPARDLNPGLHLVARSRCLHSQVPMSLGLNFLFHLLLKCVCNGMVIMDSCLR